MSQIVPEDHPLRRLFRSAVNKAFQESRELYCPQVASHLSDEVLCDFVHTDRIFRLKDSEGSALEDIQDMLPAAVAKEGPERRLEVDRYIGDFALFMVSFFPATLRSHWSRAKPMVSRVGRVLVKFQQPVDYYKAEGRNAYSRAAETARLFDPESGNTYSRLATGFEEYLDLLSRVRGLLWEEAELKELEDRLGSD